MIFLYLILTKHKITNNKIYILNISPAFIDIILFLQYIYYKQLKIDIDVFFRSLYPSATITHTNESFQMMMMLFVFLLYNL